MADVDPTVQRSVVIRGSRDRRLLLMEKSLGTEGRELADRD